MKKISLLVSGEFFFVAFLLAGYFKGGLPFIPIDITLLCLFISAVFAIKKLYGNQSMTKQTWISLLMFSILILIILVSYLVTDSVIYANEKMVRFIAITSWSFIGVYALIKDKQSLEKFINSIILIAFLVSAVGIIELIDTLKSGGYNGTIFVMNTDYLALGRTVGLGLVLMIGSKWFNDKRLSTTNMLTTLVMLVVIVFSGAKMPLIATIASLLFIIFLATRVFSNKILVNRGVYKLTGLFVISIISMMLINETGLLGNVFRRLGSLFAGGDESTLMRIILYGVSFEMIKSSPVLGSGWASFPLYYNGIDVKLYPHNIFLELFSELGIVGLLSFLMMLIYAVYHGFIVFKKRYIRYNNLQLAMIGGFVFFLFNANTTGDITDNKILFTFIALLTISNSTNKTDSEKNPQ